MSALLQALHRLWTKAVGTPDYDKKEWQRFESHVEEMEGTGTVCAVAGCTHEGSIASLMLPTTMPTRLTLCVRHEALLHQALLVRVEIPTWWHAFEDWYIQLHIKEPTSLMLKVYPSENRAVWAKHGSIE